MVDRKTYGPAAFFVLFCLPFLARAETQNHSAMITGPVGLNTVPSARMDHAGTVKAGVSTLDPYVHGFLGFQIAEPLAIGLRQTAEASSIQDDPDRLYPGLDLKLRLLEERAYVPALSIGLQSAVGHKRMAGEYMALSKRYRNFDFTAGIGWGRFGSAGHMRNPLKALSSHFGKTRAPDGEMPNEPDDWFTGENIGFFGGVEYFTSFKGLSVKFDIGADRYAAERSAFGCSAPAPWSLGVAYQPLKAVNAAIAIQGDDKIMGRLTIQGSPAGWPFKGSKTRPPKPLRPYRTELALPDEMQASAKKEGVRLYDIRHGLHEASASLDLDPNRPAPRQLGRAVRHMANHAGPAVEKMILQTAFYGLRGPRVALMRRDFENALVLKQGSAEEIWNNAVFTTEDKESAGEDNLIRMRYRGRRITFLLDNQISLSEEDRGTLYRTALVAEIEGPTLFQKIHSVTAWRINLKDNLDKIAEIRPRSPLPVRSDVDLFADNRVLLDKLYSAFTHSFDPELHMLAAAGYLEEMYGGAGGEILYRPYGKRYALGADAWLALKRDPLSALAAGFNGDSLLTGHVNGWYEFPGGDLTAELRIGRYLAEDAGATFSLQKSFKNGATLEGFVTVTDQADFDLFGGTTHAFHGVRLSLPLGSVPYVPEGSGLRVRAEPFGRDTGQALDRPLKLYDLTEPFSTRHMIRYWGDVGD